MSVPIAGWNALTRGERSVGPQWHLQPATLRLVICHGTVVAAHCVCCTAYTMEFDCHRLGRQYWQVDGLTESMISAHSNTHASKSLVMFIPIPGHCEIGQCWQAVHDQTEQHWGERISQLTPMSVENGSPNTPDIQILIVTLSCKGCGVPSITPCSNGGPKQATRTGNHHHHHHHHQSQVLRKSVNAA